MKYLIALSLLGIILTPGVAQFTTTTTFSPDFWLKKDSDLERRDPPKTGLINYHEAYEFRGDGTYLEFPFEVDEVSRFTFISVFHCTDPGEERGVWGAKNSQRAIMLSTQRVSGPKKTIRYSGGEVSIPVLNTTVQHWGKTKLGEVPPSIVLGHPGENNEEVRPFVGLIPEYLIFKKILNEEDRHKVETYMAVKYGLTLKAADYLDSEGTILWDQEKNSGFSHHIAAIGRDDFFGLHQKQSSSTAEAGRLIIGANRIAATNNANPYLLQNLDYLIWGDNGLEFALEVQLGSHGSPFTYLQRDWKMEVIGTASYELPTQVAVDLKSIEMPPHYKPWLIIDRSGMGNYVSGKLEYIEPSHITETGQAIFDQVRWDEDQSGSDAFTFAVGPHQMPSVEHFKVYANPSPGKFVIDIALQQREDIHLKIFNVQGQLVRTIGGEGQEFYQFSEELLTDGIYLIKLHTSQGTMSKELVIAH